MAVMCQFWFVTVNSLQFREWVRATPVEPSLSVCKPRKVSVDQMAYEGVKMWKIQTRKVEQWRNEYSWLPVGCYIQYSQ